jgi:hypothetical protein
MCTRCVLRLKIRECCQPPFCTSRIPYRATEEINDVTVYIVLILHGLKQGKLFVEIWNSRILPQTRQWPLQPCCSLILRWPRAKTNFQCNMALPALTATKQCYNGAFTHYQNWQKDHIVGKELHDLLSSNIQSLLMPCVFTLLATSHGKVRSCWYNLFIWFEGSITLGEHSILIQYL